MTDFNQIKSILKLRSCFRQPMKFHVSLILSNCKMYLSKGVNILLGQPVYLPDPLTVWVMNISKSRMSMSYVIDSSYRTYELVTCL